MAEPHQSYDYIVMARARPAAQSPVEVGEANKSVLLLKAGGPARSPWIHIALGYAKLYAELSVNWCYTSEPEQYLNNRRLFQPRGKVQGGTAAINGMIYMRGQRRTSTIGPPRVASAGVGTAYCLTSNHARTRSASRMPITASKGPCRSGPAVRACARRGVPWRFRKTRSAAQSRFRRRHTAWYRLRPDHHAEEAPMDAPPVSPGSCEAERQCCVARAGRDDRARGKRPVGVVWRDKSGRREARARGEVILLAEHSIRRSCSSSPGSSRGTS